MKMVSQIAFQNMKYHKNKNVLIGIAIILTTLLLFLVPTIGIDMIDAQHAVVNELYPSWYALYRGVDKNTVEKLSAYHDIARYGVRGDAGIVVDEDAAISLLYLDEEGLSLYHIELSAGRLPEKQNEIVLSKGMMKELGVTGKIGDTVLIPYQINRNGGLDYAEQKPFVITGMMNDSVSGTEQKKYSAFISKAFLESELPADEISYRFLFQTRTAKNTTTDQIEKMIDEIAAQFDIPQSDIQLNKDYLSANYIDPAIVPAIVGIMCIIMLAGIITIYSIYYVGMSSRIQEYGRIKAIGATKKQLKQIVLREGLSVACIAIPIGLLLGTVLTGLIFKLLLHTYQDENILMVEMQHLYEQGDITLYHLSFYLLTVGITLLAVWISLKKPMKVAAKVSEIEAIHYQNQEGKDTKKKKKQKRKSVKNVSIFQLSKIYITCKKRNSLATIGAMSITGIFVMVVATVLACGNPVESANYSIMSQYELSNKIELGNKEHPEREWGNVIQNNPLNNKLKSQIENMDGVKKVECIKEVNVACPQLEDDWLGVVGLSDEYADEIMDGITEGTAAYDDLKSGDNVVADIKLLISHPGVKVGDTLKLVIQDGNESHTKEVTVIAFGDYSLGFTQYNFLLMSDEGLQTLCDGNINGTLRIYTTKEDTVTLADQLNQLVEKNELLKIRTWQEEYDKWASALSLTNGACYMLLGILGAICIMNLVNTMIQNVHLRKKEIGMMQAIGMTDQQVSKMLHIEGVFYTLTTLIVSIGAGSLLGYPMFLWAKKNVLFNINRYHYPITAAIIIFIVLLVIQMILASVLSRSVKKESLIERIRYSE